MSTIRLAFIADGEEPWREIGVAAQPPRGRKASNVLVVPGAQVLSRWMPVAGSTPAQMRAAALNALAPDLAQPADACIAAIGAANASGLRLVAIAARNDVEAWSAAAQQRGFTPDIITPDFALLPAPAEDTAIIARRAGDVVVRDRLAAFTCQAELLDLLLPDRTTEEHDFEAEAVHATRQGRLFDAPDFAWAAARKRDVAERPFPIVRIAAAAGVALLLGAAAPWIHALRLDAAARDFRREAETIARTALPDATRIVNPRAQLEEALLPARAGGRLAAAAAAIIEGASAAPGASISRLEADAEIGVSASLSINSAGDLEPIRARLAALGMQAEESSGAPVAGRTPVDIVARMPR